MNFLQTTTTSTQPAVTMTSLEMVDFINTSRGSAESLLRHDHFTAQVPLVLGSNAPEFLGTQTYGNNNTRDIYVFPKREACLMAMSYSYALQARVFDRMTALEAQVAKPAVAIPQNFGEALRLAAESWERAQVAENDPDLEHARFGWNSWAAAWQPSAIVVRSIDFLRCRFSTGI